MDDAGCDASSTAVLRGIAVPTMTEERSFCLTVVLAGADEAAVLSVVAMLHRRAVPLDELTMTRPGAGRRVVTAMIGTTPARADLVAMSLRSLVDVVSVELCQR